MQQPLLVTNDGDSGEAAEEDNESWIDGMEDVMNEDELQKQA